MAHLQFCRDGRDSTGDWYAAEDTDEVRCWEEDGTCLGAVLKHYEDGGNWYASASDVTDWSAVTTSRHGGRLSGTRRRSVSHCRGSTLQRPCGTRS